MPKQKPTKKQILTKLNDHAGVEKALKKAMDQDKSRKQAAKEEKAKISEIAVNYLMLIAFLALSLTTFVISFDSIEFFRENVSATITFKILLVIGFFISYLKLREALQQLLFPQTHRKVVKTVFKYPYEDRTSDGPVNNLTQDWVGNAFMDYSMLAVVAIIIGLVVVVNPAVLPFTFGLLSDSNAGGVVFKVIIIALTFGIYISVRNLIVTQREYRNLQEVIWRARNLKVNFKKGVHYKELLPAHIDSLVAKKMRTILHILKLEGHVDQETLYSKSFMRHALKDSFPKYLAASMPILGLIGTLLGLSTAIQGMELVLSGGIDDPEQLTAGLAGSLSGIGTAFYTTLEGAIAMLILKYFNMAVTNKRLTFLADMDEAIAVEVIPRLQKRHKFVKIIDK